MTNDDNRRPHLVRVPYPPPTRPTTSQKVGTYLGGFLVGLVLAAGVAVGGAAVVLILALIWHAIRVLMS
jgi:hypothetical protein